MEAKQKEPAIGIIHCKKINTKTGEIIEDYGEEKNLTTNAGLASRASRLIQSSDAPFTIIGLGTGTTAAANTDTQLESEITTGGGARKTATGSRVTTAVSNDTSQLSIQFDFTATFAISELGIFNASSGGTLYARKVYSSPKNVTNGESLVFTWKMQQTRT